MTLRIPPLRQFQKHPIGTQVPGGLHDLRLARLHDGFSEHNINAPRGFPIRPWQQVCVGAEGEGRLAMTLGDAYLGKGVPDMWTGGPASVEIDLRGGIEEMLGSRGAPNL